MNGTGEFQRQALNFIKIDKDEFEKMTPTQQNYAIHQQGTNTLEFLAVFVNQCEARKKCCEERFNTMNKPKSKIRNIFALAGVGIVILGGTVYAIGIEITKKIIDIIGKIISWF